jgi:hypothetical protein
MKNASKYIEELVRQKMMSAFYKAWVDEKLQYLEWMESYFNKYERQGDEKPPWNNWQLPELVGKNDQTTAKRKPVCKSWDDYFGKQRSLVDAFLRAGHIIPFCRELEWFIRESVRDKRTTNILKCWLLLLLDVVRSAHLAKYPFDLLREVDHQVLLFDQSIHYYWGWHHEIAPMLPDYLLGKKRRENLKIWGKHKDPYDRSEDVDSRNERIRKAADDIRNSSKKRNKSNLEIARILNVLPYQFQTVDKKPLSLRQIRKIIS